MQYWVMFSARCAEMGESGFAPTRQITNRFLVYMWKMYKAHFFWSCRCRGVARNARKMENKQKRYYDGCSRLRPYRKTMITKSVWVRRASPKDIRKISIQGTPVYRSPRIFSSAQIVAQMRKYQFTSSKLRRRPTRFFNQRRAGW